MAQAFAKRFYNSKQWQQTRELAMMRDNRLCVKCHRPAEEVHHIIRLSEKNINDPNVTMNLDNLMCLCYECHKKEHRWDVKSCLPKISFDAQGNIIPPR